MSELEQMVVACDDRIGPGSKCAFENSVIGFIVAHEIHRLGGMDQDGKATNQLLRFAAPRRPFRRS